MVASRDALGATFGPPWSGHTGRIHARNSAPTPFELVHAQILERLV